MFIGYFTTDFSFIDNVMHLCSWPHCSRRTVNSFMMMMIMMMNLLTCCDVWQGGCVDTIAQGLSCVLMAFGDQDVSKLQCGPLSDYT